MFKIQYDMNLYKKDDIKIKMLSKPPKLTFDNHLFEEMAYKRYKQSKNYQQQMKLLGKPIEKGKLTEMYEKNDKLTHLFMNLKSGKKAHSFFNTETDDKAYFTDHHIRLQNPGSFRKEWDDKKILTNKNLGKEPVQSIITTMKGDRLHKRLRKFDVCVRQKLVFPYDLYFIYSLFKVLKPSGSLTMHILNYCNMETFEFLYLLALMFEYVVFVDGIYIYCHNFLPDYRITQSELKNIIQNRYFTIEPKPYFDDLIYYLEKNAKARTRNLYQGADWIVLQKDQFKKVYFELFDLIYLFNFVENMKAFNWMDNIRNYLHQYVDTHSVDKFMKYYYPTLYIQYLDNLRRFIKKKKKKIHSILELDIGWGVQTLYLMNHSPLSIKEYQCIDSHQPNIDFKDIKWVKFHIKSENFHYHSDNAISLLPGWVDEDRFYNLILMNNMYNTENFMMKFIFLDKLVNSGGYIIVYNILNYRFRNFYTYIIQEYQNYKIYFNNENMLILQKK